jgi:mRNA interferase MazF
VQRGDIYELRLPKGIGHKQRGRRLGVVVQSDAMLSRSVVLVAPTSTSARAASFRPQFDVAGQPTRVLVEQLGAIDVNRLGERVGRVTNDQQWQVDAALLTVLGLD